MTQPKTNTVILTTLQIISEFINIMNSW